jgi:hypothetical protein
MASLLKNRASLVVSAVLLTPILLVGNGCAKIAEPRPPQIHIPKPGVDLAVRQLADSVVLTVSFPVQNTDGSESKTLQTLEVLRITENANAIKNPEPLSERQFINTAVRILSIPSSRFPDYLQDKEFVIPDKLLFPDKSVIYSNAFRYAVLFVNNHNQSAGLSNQVLIAPVPIPSSPAGFSAKVTENSIRLTWLAPSENMDGSRPARIAGYNIYKSENAGKFSSTSINRDPVQTPEFEDRSFEFDRSYYYEITVLGSRQNPFAESNRSAVLTVIPRDVFPPAPPKDFSAIVQEGTTILLWAPSPSPDVAGYRIYRREEGTTDRQLLTKELIATFSFRDTDVKSDRRYEYLIKAVDTHGNESTEVIATSESLK